MSGYIVSQDDLNCLVTYLDRSSDTMPIVVRRYTNNQVNKYLVEQIGEILQQANYDGVNARYQACNTPLPYKFVRYTKKEHLEPIVIIKLCDHFDYQSCDAEAYKTSDASKIINMIRKEAIRQLPGYDNAPWGI